MKNQFIATTIIILFIGVAVAPSINFNTVKAFTDDDLVEVTTQACGIQGYKDTTVKLTSEQYQNLELYLVEFRERLNQTSTREETIPIFKEAVVELDKYGLLPSGMSVEKAQQLVKGNFQGPQMMNVYRTMSWNSQILNHSNFFCLISGQTTMNTRFFSFIEMGSSTLCWILYISFLFAQNYIDNPVLINNTLSLLKSIRNFFYKINSARITGTGIITFGHSHPASIPPPYRYDPAQGWITTLGVFGKKSWNGTFFGRLFWMAPFNSESYLFYPGAVGFVGIKLNTRDGTFFFLGSSLLVSIK